MKLVERLEQLHLTILPLSETGVLKSGHKISVLESVSHAKLKTSKSDYGGCDSNITEAWGSSQSKSLLSTDNTAELQQENEHLWASLIALEHDVELEVSCVKEATLSEMQ